MWRQAASWLTTLLSAPALFLAAEGAALSRDDEALGFERTPPRLAFADGPVSFFRADGDAWTPARVNTALAAGDSLATGEAGNLEIQAGARAWLRAGELTTFSLHALEPDFLQLRLDAGTLALDLRELAPGQTFELSTPHGVFRIEEPGYYRAGVLDELTTFSSRRGGRAEARAFGTTLAIASGEQLVLYGGADPGSESFTAPELDAWDRWNYARTDAQLAPASARYLPADVYGAGDLDAYGDWRSDATYGALWVPRAVPVGWAPYRAGYWMTDPYYGMTWVDDAPWGWAPFHYGRWVYTSGFWGWCPGPRVARAYYAPALVAFSDDFYFSFGAPSYSWVALGWGEPLHPWWGPSHFRGHAHWAGWGGPRHHHWDRHDRDDHDRGHGGGHHGDRDRDYGRGDKDRDHRWDRDRDRDRHDRRDSHDGRGGDRHRDLRDYRNASVRDGVVAPDRRHFARRSEQGELRRGRGDERHTPRSARPSPRDGRRSGDEREHAARRGNERGPERDFARRPGAQSRQGTRSGQSVRRPPFERGEILRDSPPPAPRPDGAERREPQRRVRQDADRARPPRERAEQSERQRVERSERPALPPVEAAPPAQRERREQAVPRQQIERRERREQAAPRQRERREQVERPREPQVARQQVREPARAQRREGGDGGRPAERGDRNRGDRGNREGRGGDRDESGRSGRR
jgi:hypothetical protein